MAVAPAPAATAGTAPAAGPAVESLCCPALLTAPLSDDDAGVLAGVLKALADPVRLRLVSIIASAPGGEACACDLAAPTGRSQPTVSHHLSQLVAAGILEREQRGKWAWFRVRADQLSALCDALGPAGQAICAPRHDGDAGPSC